MSIQEMREAVDMMSDSRLGAFSFTVSKDDYADLVSAGEFASTDQARPLLTGVLFEIRGELVRAVATDSYRLCVIERGLDTDSPYCGESALIPASLLSDALKGFTKSTGKKANYDVTVRVSREMVSISASHPDAPTVYSGRVIDGTYPAYETLIPAREGIKECPAPVAFNPRFLASLVKVAPWCNDSKGSVPARLESLNDQRRPFTIVGVCPRTRNETICLFMPVIIA